MKINAVPKFKDHPDAKCFVQNDDGQWFKNTSGTNVVINDSGGWDSLNISYGWFELKNKTLVVGDSWERSLMIRPEEQDVLSNFTQQEYDQLHEEIAMKDALIAELLEQINVLSEEKIITYSYPNRNVIVIQSDRPEFAKWWL